MLAISESRRYREIKNIIPKSVISIGEALEFLKEQNREKIKKIKISFFLNYKEKKQELQISKKGLLLPYSVRTRRFLVVIKDALSDELLEILSSYPSMKILSIDELESFLVRKDGKLQKKNLRKIEKILVHPKSEQLIKFLEKKLSMKGMYPNKKNGWLTENILEEVDKVEKGERILKADKNGNINTFLGVSSLTLDELMKNYSEMYTFVTGLRPSNWKGSFLKKIVLSTIMSPGVRVSI